jgi:hypothetical protein
MSDDDIVVEIEKETPAEDVKVATEAAKTDPVADLKAQYDELQEQKKREADGRQAAERRASEEASRRAAAEQEVQTTRGEMAETRLTSVTDGIEAAKSEADGANNEYVAALEQGDWKKAGDAQRRMARAEAKILHLDNAKAALETEQAAPRQAAPPAPPADPVAAFIARCEPNTAAWMRAHPEDARVLATDMTSRRAKKLMAADSDAQSEGYVAGSAEYFEHVETFLGMRKEQAVEVEKPATAVKPVRKVSAPVAPVQQSGGVVFGGDTTVHLTQGEARAATDGTLVWNYSDTSGQNKFKKGEPIGVQEFARRKKQMKEQGAYDRHNYEQ